MTHIDPGKSTVSFMPLYTNKQINTLHTNKHIEAEMAAIFWHFQMYFIEWKFIDFN